MKKIFVLCFMALVTVQVFFAQSRGMTVTAPDGATLTSFSGSHALVIGESAYNKGWMPLSGVKEDVTAVKRLFEEQGFSVTLLEDKTSRELITGIEDFFDRYGYEKDVRLIIYYAGHGQTLKLDNTRDMGYIVPIDAPVPARDETGFKRLAIPMQQFDTWAKKYESRHIMYIFDSCFSGSIFDTSRAAPGIIDYKISQPVRQFIASGAADETVPDKSIFRRQLEAGLRDRDADLNNDGYVSGSELGDFLQTTVVNYSNSAQHPQYGKIRDPNLDKGDFVFSVGITQRQEITLAAPVSQELEVGSVSVASGALKINTITAGRLSITINNTNRDIGDLPGYASLPIPTISAGVHEVQMVYEDGYTEKKNITVERDKTVEVNFIYRPNAVIVEETQPRPVNNRSSFSGGQRAGAVALNFVLGLGSFTMGDPLGGSLVLAGYAASAGMIAVEILLMEDGVIGTVGLGVAGLTAVFGIIRPLFFEKKSTQAKNPSLDLLSGISAGIVPDRQGKASLMLSYTHRF